MVTLLSGYCKLSPGFLTTSADFIQELENVGIQLSRGMLSVFLHFRSWFSAGVAKVYRIILGSSMISL